MNQQIIIGKNETAIEFQITDLCQLCCDSTKEIVPGWHEIVDGKDISPLCGGCIEKLNQVRVFVYDWRGGSNVKSYIRQDGKTYTRVPDLAGIFDKRNRWWSNNILSPFFCERVYQPPIIYKEPFQGKIITTLDENGNIIGQEIKRP